jgi:hypothetical protein
LFIPLKNNNHKKDYVYMVTNYNNKESTRESNKYIMKQTLTQRFCHTRRGILL